MLKKHIFITIMAIICSQTAWAESSDFGWAKKIGLSKQETFSESELPLPAVPQPEQGEWLDIYVNETYTKKPRILLDSITLAEDGSVRYLFNSRSARGYDNITAEGIRCTQGIFNSDGMLHKIFAYADLDNQRWIVPRHSQWQNLGGNRNAADPVRRVLYEVVCVNHKLKDADTLRKTLKDEAGKRR